jgi:hypothetical protein
LLCRRRTACIFIRHAAGNSKTLVVNPPMAYIPTILHVSAHQANNASGVSFSASGSTIRSDGDQVVSCGEIVIDAKAFN